MWWELLDSKDFGSAQPTDQMEFELVADVTGRRSRCLVNELSSRLNSLGSLHVAVRHAGFAGIVERCFETDGLYPGTTEAIPTLKPRTVFDTQEQTLLHPSRPSARVDVAVKTA